ncbi:membrane protein insertase YidC [Ferruginivarius sediminum]|uniref:Membrane protein insertase YidC n=1 Tax=Ferruginivarius sediminum TaxID=2661937 RepID=A0A369T4T3_9PROT|nr:membrane protein insertase YidC [Ferruginivarius sediminum]
MEQRNLILAIVASVAILLGFELLYNAPQREAELAQQVQQQQQQTSEDEQPTSGANMPQAQQGEVPGAAPGVPNAPDRDELVAEGPRVTIDTPTLRGSISLVGGRIDDLTLRNYEQTIEPDSGKIDLLSPPGSEQAYYAAFGWVAAENGADLPNGETRWSADGETLAPGRDLTLTWTNDAGLTFTRVYAIDERYMFTVTQRVTNESGDAVSLAPYGLISRRGTPDTLGYYILHEGPIGVLNGTLEEIDYDDLQDDGPITQRTTGGWLGITDKYWLVSLIPDQDTGVRTRFLHADAGGVSKYQTDFMHDSVRLQAGESLERTSRLFAGAKEVSVLDHYKDNLGVPMFDKAVDFGWFYFLTKPLFKMLHFFAQYTGNFGVAILILVVIIKLLFFPLANKSYRSMAKMRKLQPEMVKLRERFADDKQRLNQEMMALYKREGANPASGCLPILVQIPVFFALYKVLFVTIEMRHAPFFGWIQDLSAKDPTAITNLFGLAPWGVPELGALSVVNIGILPLIMGVTMYLQHMLNPQPADPTQAKIFKLMPIMFTFLLAQFPAGLVVYWTWNNLLTILQQYVIMRRAGMQIGGKQESMLPALGKTKGDAKESEKEEPAASTKAADGAEEKQATASQPDEEESGEAGKAALATAEAGAGSQTQSADESAVGGKAQSGGERPRNPAAKSRSKGRGSGGKGRKGRKR